jgi:hypothetical protein
LLFFAQYSVEITDRFFQFAPEPLGTFGIRLGGKLAGTACAARSGSAGSALFPGSAPLGAFTSTGTTAGCFGGIARGRAAAQAFSGLAHTANPTRERTGVAAVAGTIAIAVTTIGAFAACPIGSFATAHARHAAGRGELDLWNAAHAAGLPGTAAGCASAG